MSHWIMGVLSALFGVIGLLMAGAAHDFGDPGLRARR